MKNVVSNALICAFGVFLFCGAVAYGVIKSNNENKLEPMNKVLVVIDCQNDFIDGSLANPDAQKAIPSIVDKIRNHTEKGDVIFATMDTHGENYLNTAEGKKLPVVHCVKGTDGWQINDNVKAALDDAELRGVKVTYVEKPTFGSYDLIKLSEKYVDADTKIEVIGFVSSICVISNALMLKARYYENEMSVDVNCTAGLSYENNEAALEVMRSCQIDVK